MIPQGPIGRLPFAAIDFESSGALLGETDLPIQIGVVRVDSLFGKEECFVSCLACERGIRRSATKLHGITLRQLQNAPTLLSLWPTLKRLLSGCVIVGHNPSTEWRFLRVFPGHGFSPWLDTLALARRCMPRQREWGLSAVCEALGVVERVNKLVPGRTWHDALYDAAASLEVLRSVVGSLQLEERSLRTLHFAVKSRQPD